MTLGVLWELDEDMLKDCKLNRVEKLQYSSNEVVKKHSLDQANRLSRTRWARTTWARTRLRARISGRPFITS